jgi:hypothetical protein
VAVEVVTIYGKEYLVDQKEWKLPKARDSLGHDKEYAEERIKWYGLLKDTGFHDIEKDDGELEQAPDRYQFNDALPHETGVFDLITVDVYNAALHRFNFKSGTDCVICEFLAAGKSFREIKKTLDVGQYRIERVRADVKSWHDLGFNLLSDVE